MKVAFCGVEVETGDFLYFFQSVINGVSVYKEGVARLLYASVAVKILFQSEEKFCAGVSVVFMEFDGGLMTKGLERER